VVRALTRREQAEFALLGVTVLSSAPGGACSEGCGACGSAATTDDGGTCAGSGAGRKPARSGGRRDGKLSANPKGGGGGGRGGIPDLETEEAIDDLEDALENWFEHPGSTRAELRFERAHDALYDPGDPYAHVPRVVLPDVSDNCLNLTAEQLNRRCPPPYLLPATLPTQQQADDHKGLSVTIGVTAALSSSDAGCEFDLLKMAALLIDQNQDLLSYALCLAGAGNQKTSCMLDILSHSWWPWDKEPDIVLRDHIAPDLVGYPAVAWANPVTKEINLDQSSDWWACMVEKFCSGDASSRTCAAVDVAAVIVHEAMHLCWADLTDRPDRCSIVYLVENTYRWAMLQRYPDSLNDSGCAAAAKPLDDSVQEVPC
jgi:hypothetical protein